MSDSLDEQQSNNNLAPGGRKPIRSLVEPAPILESAEPVQLQIEILKETYDDILHVLRLNELEHDEGLRTVLLSGLGYMDATLKLGQINRAISGGGKQAEHVEALVQDLASYHSMYSVLKYKTFKLYRLSQKLELNVAGLRAAEEMWAEWAERMRRERAEMQAEIIKLRALMSEFNIDIELPPTSLRTYQPVAAEPYPLPKNPDDLSTMLDELPCAVERDRSVSFWARLRRLLGWE